MVPSPTGLVGVLILAAWTGPDPQALIARLGSARYAEREAASSALEKLGQTAFPALKTARNHPDPEVKNRAEVLLDSLERSMIARPASLDLPAGRYEAADLVDRLSRAEGIPLPLADLPERDARGKRSLTLRSPETIPFWKVLDRLNLSLVADSENDFGRPMQRRATTLRLISTAEARPPSSDGGPFRVVAYPPVMGVDRPGFEPGFRGPGVMPPQGPRRRDLEVDLRVPMELWVEPRLSLRTIGVVRIFEAADNQGRPLIPDARPSGDVAAPFGMLERSGPVLPFLARFRPALPGSRSIRVLRGAVSAEVESRRLDPATVALSAPSIAEQPPLPCGGSTLLLRGLTGPGPMFRAGYLLEVTIRPEDWPRRLPLRGGMRGMRNAADRQDLSAELQCLDVVDAQGQPFRIGPPRSVDIDGDGFRVSLPLTPRDGSVAAPTELRVFGQIRTMVEIPFEFRDLKLPL